MKSKITICIKDKNNQRVFIHFNRDRSVAERFFKALTMCDDDNIKLVEWQEKRIEENEKQE